MPSHDVSLPFFPLAFLHTPFESMPTHKIEFFLHSMQDKLSVAILCSLPFGCRKQTMPMIHVVWLCFISNFVELKKQVGSCKMTDLSLNSWWMTNAIQFFLLRRTAF